MPCRATACHSLPYSLRLETCFLRRDFWYLSGVASPCALLNPFAPFSVYRLIAYVSYMRFSARPQRNKFSIWLLAKKCLATWQPTRQAFGILCIEQILIGAQSQQVAKPVQNHLVAAPAAHDSEINFGLNVSHIFASCFRKLLEIENASYHEDPLALGNFLMKSCGCCFDTFWRSQHIPSLWLL